MCGYYSPSEPLTFLSARQRHAGVMATNDKENYQVPKGKAVKVAFKKFLMSEPGRGEDCPETRINGKK
ncbi:ST14 transmembrane serine protease matriptase a [Lates japonicus]|uniref:ST14 transmembrane serine protease matriptase a n=1 Tax=Lates japonicus TaxID=270547 RepID=A0AAD3RMU6_LATJO|nr:ST14 transmembrane serine protease matriptase a [Lates japonicus]